MRIYLAGPMRGRFEFNTPAFRKAANDLRALGHEVYCPPEIDRLNGYCFDGLDGTSADLADLGFDIGASMADGLSYICQQADCLVLLEDLEASLDSLGTSAEIATALAIGLPVRYVWQLLGES